MRQQLLASLVTAYEAAGLGLPTVHEGFEDPAAVRTARETGGPWAVAEWLDVDKDDRLQTVSKVRGIYQIELNYKEGTGRKGINDSMDTLLAHFAPHHRFEYTGLWWLKVKQSEPSRVRDEDGWQRGVVSVTFDTTVDRAFPS